MYLLFSAFLQDLSDVAKISIKDLKDMSDGAFKAMLKMKNLPLQALKDLEPDRGDGDGSVDFTALPLPAPPVGPPPDEVIKLDLSEFSLASIDCDIAGLIPMRVNFDNCSHQSGRRRAFLYCKAHDNCRAYVFVDDFSTRERAAAYLFAWGNQHSDYPRRDQAQEHIMAKPDEFFVDLFYNEQFQR